MLKSLSRSGVPLVLACACALFPGHLFADASNVRVSRFWHNHQPIYWPEWNSAPQNERVQVAWDSINLKSGQIYDSSSQHPENNLSSIFVDNERPDSYQRSPKNSLASVGNTAGGYAMSYSGSLIENVHSLGAVNQLGYSPGWWNDYRTAIGWTTPSGSPRLDMVGFTYHHSLGAVIPKEVFRKEIQIFHEVAYKAWARGSVTNRSKGFFPTEMAFSRHMIDVLADEGYQWTIVASHHLSRTSPVWSEKANPQGTYGIYSSPPNKADQIGPVISNGWWYGSGQVEAIRAWNVSPFAYQLHRAKYVNPETGAEKSILMVPSEDVMSYQYGYLDEGTGKITSHIAQFATDPARPVIVMPSTDGDNAWAGGASSWGSAAPALMNNGTYAPTAPQDFVNQFGGAAGTVHIEDGAWIFPESDYGSPNFLKWVEPPVSNASATNRVYNTQVDIETPGFTSKFYSWAPVISGANWCITAEQMWTNQNGPGSVAAWKIQAPYDNLVGAGAYTSPNIVERAWHIYLAGLDSGFNYYGGLGNDDEVKSSLATRRAVEMLKTYVTNNLANDRTAPTVFKPQRFPYNPGWYTFGWMNSIPGGNTSALKRMRSEFYVWTHAYDISGITNIVLKIRRDNDGTNPLNSNQNETFAGGGEVGSWVSVPMTKRILPNTAAALNAAANNSQIQYFSQALSPEVADYYFAKVDASVFPNLKNSLFDYYIEATDSRGNTSKSDLQHVWVEHDGFSSVAPPQVTNANATAQSSTSIQLDWAASAGATSYLVTRNGSPRTNVTGTSFTDTGLSEQTLYSYTITASNDAGSAPASDPAAATTPAFIDGAPTSLIVTTPSSSVNTSNASFAFIGQAGAQLTNGIRWTNLLSGASGSFPRARDWTNLVPLALGTNVVVFSATYPFTGVVALAQDSAADGVYNAGWTNGTDGGSGFGPWALSATGSAGHFLANNPGNLNVGDTKGFGLWANSGGTSAAQRDFDSALQAGDTVTIRFDNNGVDTNGAVGFGLADGSGTTRFQFFLRGGEATYRIHDTTSNRDSGVATTSGGLLLAFELLSSTSYRFTVGTNIITGTLAGGGSLSRLMVTNFNAGPGSGNDFFLGAITRSAAAGGLATSSVTAPAVIRTSGEFIDLNPAALLVTTPAVLVNASTNTFAYIGQAGAQLTNGITWSNQLTGATGFIPYGRDWTNALPLGVGTNVIVFSSTYGSGSTGSVVIARDAATNAAYAGGWADGSNGGAGFGPWSLTGTGNAGRFLADNPANLNVGDTKGFGLWANGGGVSVARRDFNSPLVPGDIVTVRFDNNWIDNGGSVGIGLTDAGDTNRLAFYFIGGQSTYRINDATNSRVTAIGYTDLGLLLSFELLSSNSYRLVTGTNIITGVLDAGGPLVRLAATNFNAGPNTERNFYLGEITRSTTLSGFSVTNVTAPAVVWVGGNSDTDGDGLPDAWETLYFGSNTGALPGADDDGDGFSNLQEFLLGTVPTNAMSTFRIHTVAHTGSVLNVSWPSVPGRTYQVQSSASLGTAWTNAGSPVTAQPGETNLSRPVAGTGSNFFVRVILTP